MWRLTDIDSVQVSLSQVCQLTLEERRGYLTLLLVTASPTVRLLLRRPDGLTDWLASIRNLSGPGKERDTSYRRQLSEYGTFQNTSRGESPTPRAAPIRKVSVSRNSVDESPCSSIGRQYSSPRQRPQSYKPGENLYGCGGRAREEIYQEPLHQASNSAGLRLNQAMFS